MIIAGTSWDYSASPLHNSILLVKYDSSGNYLWSENYLTPWTSTTKPQDEAAGVTTDGAGNIYIAGHHSYDCKSDNFSNCSFISMVIKVDPNGSFLWSQAWGPAGYGLASGIALNPAGDIVFASMDNVYGPGTPSLVALRYDTSGNLLASSTWTGLLQTFMGQAPHIAIDSRGYAWLAANAGDARGHWAAAPAATSTLPNSFTTTSYTLRAPSASLTSPTNATLSQAGISDIGGGASDVFVTELPHTLSAGPR